MVDSKQMIRFFLREHFLCFVLFLSSRYIGLGLGYGCGREFLGEVQAQQSFSQGSSSAKVNQSLAYTVVSYNFPMNHNLTKMWMSSEHFCCIMCMSRAISRYSISITYFSITYFCNGLYFSPAHDINHDAGQKNHHLRSRNNRINIYNIFSFLPFQRISH